MILELGPWQAATAVRWCRLGRRMIVELRTRPEDLEGIASEDILRSWTGLIDQIESETSCEDLFRLSAVMEDDEAEFLLHGLDRFLRSDVLQRLLTSAEAHEHGGFTMHVVEGLTTGLLVEGRGCEHFLDDTRALIGRFS